MLPTIANVDEYRRFRRDAEGQRAGVHAIARRHGLAPSELEPFEKGTHLVWGTRDRVVKLFVPLWPEDAAIESATLALLTGTGLPTPQVEARGQLDGWSYVVMSRLPGQRIGDAWPTLSADERERLAHAAGEVMARLRGVPAHDLEWRRTEQPELLVERRAKLVADQRERGGDDALAAELQTFLAELPSLAPAPCVLLHADLHDDHFLVSGGAITGLIDFADAFVGPWTYELATPACFLTRGQPGARRALLAGYGVSESDDLAAAVRTWAVLHRYGHVAIMMRRAGASTLRDWLDETWPPPTPRG